MHVQPAAESWSGVTPSAFAETAVAHAAPSAAIAAISTVRLFMPFSSRLTPGCI
jgi:hypothetical protein